MTTPLPNEGVRPRRSLAKFAAPAAFTVSGTAATDSGLRNLFVFIKPLAVSHIARAALSLAFLLALPSAAFAASQPPNLKENGAIAALRARYTAINWDIKQQTYNLGATGLRGWIFLTDGDPGQQGLLTAPSRQILVTVAEAPGNAVLAVDDLILGAMAANTGTVPEFNSDCRKALGVALGNAEKTGAGTLRVKRWRAGAITDVNIPMSIMGNYSGTGPYSCPKSGKILAEARNKFVNQLLANPNFLTNGYSGAINALALLASVAPGDPNYAEVQTRLQSYARALAPTNLTVYGCNTWNYSYRSIFLSEYYLRSVADGAPDTSVLHGLNAYVVALAKAQGRYGTFGHGGAVEQADGSLHGPIPPYGPVNAAGIPANIALVLGRKVLESTGGSRNPEIDPAITRASNFFSFYVNKGSIAYGEQEPELNGHASNGKDPMCAVLFGLQENRPVETEYFARMSVAGCTGREYGHTGQGLSYLWGTLGANMGGQTAAAKFMENIQWHSDLIRRTDGSFTYHGSEQYGAGGTLDGTYLGVSGYDGGNLNPTATYLLSYGVSLKRLYITGRNAYPANTLSAAKVANSIAAATIKQDVVGYTVPQLMAALGDYDPIVRNDVAAELAGRPLTTEVNTLIALITNSTMSSQPNVRMGACETLGRRRTNEALPALAQRLSDSDLWVRGKAARALAKFSGGANSQLTPMLTAFAANATDPDVIVWDDPIQISNSFLAETLFSGLSNDTIQAPKSLLYPSVRAGLKQPSGLARNYLSGFVAYRLSLEDVKALAPSMIRGASERAPGDQMFSDYSRNANIRGLGRYKIEEAIPLSLQFKEQTWHSDDALPFELLRDTYRGAARDALPTLYKWRAHLPLFAQDGAMTGENRFQTLTANIHSTIAAIENDANPPTLTYFKTLTATATPATVVFPTTTTALTATMSSIGGGIQNVIWSKLTGPGAVTFSPTGLTASSSASATFNVPGTYVLRARSVNRSILNYNQWTAFSLGYFNFGTYNEILGAATADVTVTVSADPNRAPVSQNQNLTTALNFSVPAILTATDADGNSLSYIIVSAPLHGALSGTPPNLVFTPTNGYTGSDTFTFKANDGKVDSTVATVTIAIGVAGNRNPVAVNQIVRTPEETAKPITLVGTDADGNPLTYSVVTLPTRGTLTGTAPNLTYLPASNYPADNFNGNDSFTFTVRDSSLTSAAATVNITITPVNDAPQATAQAVNVTVGEAKPITLSGTDAEIYPLSYALVTYPTHGTLSGIAPNLIYKAAANYRGPDSFTFKVTDSEGVISATATVSITVVNDPPVAVAQVVKMTQNTSLAITLTGTDPTNDALTYNVVSAPASGSLSGSAPNLTYTPTSNFIGSDSFTFRVNDGSQNSASATVSIRVAQVQTWTNIAPGNWSTSANWNGGANPATGGSSNGTLVFNAGGYSGASSNDLSGTFLLNRVNFGSALSEITVGGNDLSFVQNTTTLPEINQSSAQAVTISNKLTLAAGMGVSGSGGGSLTLSGVISGTGSLTQAHDGNLNLTAANTYSGGTYVEKGTFTLGNQYACGSGPITLAAGSTFQQANFEGNDPDLAVPNAIVLSGIGKATINMPFSYKDVWLSQLVSGSGGFAVQGGGRALTLTASNTFSGGIALKASARVIISNLNALGTGPFHSEVIRAATGRLVTSAPLTSGSGVANAFSIGNHAFLNLDTEYSNHLLLSGPITSPGGIGHLYKLGSATLTLSGANTYTGTTTVADGILVCKSPSALGQGRLEITNGKLNLDYTGTRQIASLSLSGYEQANGTHGSTASPATNKNDTYFSGTGMVTVGPSNNAPVALAQNANTAEDTSKAITLTATDVDLSALTYSIVTLPTKGTLSGTAPNVTYVPAINYNGPDSFTFKANDGTLDSAVVTVTISVTAVNDAPIAVSQNVITEVGVAKPITLVGTDVEANALSFVIVIPPSNGTLSGTPPNVVYTPSGYDDGADSFTFKVNDGITDSLAAQVSITKSSGGFTWNSANSGNWSDGSKWVSGVSPGNNGLASYTFNFNPVGIYTSNNDLGSGFLLNRINFSGSTVTLAGNGLSLVADGSKLPQVAQNSANPAAISATVRLNANTSLTGSGGGELTFSGIVSGGSSLTKATSGNLTLSGPNTYTGGTSVNSGTLTLAHQYGLGTGALTMAAGTTFQQSNFEGNSSDGAVPNALVLTGSGNVIMHTPFSGGLKDVWLSQRVSGSGGLTVQGGSRSLTLTGNNTFSGGVTLTNSDNRIQIGHLNALGSGTFRSELMTAGINSLITLENLSTAPGVANAFDITPGAYLNVAADGGNHLLLSGSIASAAGVGHLHKSGSATLTLSGINTYTGTTTVTAGILACNAATALGQGPAIITGGKLSLNYTGTRRVASLSLGGVLQRDGSYGSSASPATTKNDTYFTGVGMVTVGGDYTWSSAEMGNWSEGHKWTGNNGPSGAGMDICVLNFNVTGIYTSTHDMSSGFLVNKLNFGGSTATLTGNSLALDVSSGSLPHINQNSGSEVVVSNNLILVSNTIIGGTGNGELTLSGIVSGGRTLTKTHNGNLKLSGSNTYGGGILVNSGTLTLAHRNGLGTGALTMAAGTTFQQSSFEGNSSEGAVPNALILSGNGNVIMHTPFSGGLKDVWLSQPVSGSGGLTVQGGNRSLTLTGNNTFGGGVKLINSDNKIQIAHLNALGTGVFRSERMTSESGSLATLEDLSIGSGVPNAFDIAAGAYLNISAEGSNHLLLSGPITSAAGMGHLHKSGSATLTVSGMNTYTGATTVAGGILACNAATAVGQGPIVITGGKLNLNYAGTRQVASLSLGGVMQSNGSYGSTASSAGNKNNTYFSGVGTVTVGPVPSAVAGYETWAKISTHGLTPGVNDSILADPDRDGICNLVEYALGGAPMVSSAKILPTFSKSSGNWIFEYNRSDEAHETTNQVVEHGSDLIGWTAVPIPAASTGIFEIIPGSPADRVKVTIPNQGPQRFIRLKVTKK